MLAVSFFEVAEIVFGVTLSGTGLIALFAKFKDRKPVKWVLAQLVVEPASEILDRRIRGNLDAAISESLSGLTDQVERLGQVVHSIHYEMHPNSGASLRDVLDRVEGTAIHTSGEVEALKDGVTDLRDRTARLEGSVDILKGK